MSKQKKAPAAKSNDAEQIILGYLREHNRPYSAKLLEMDAEIEDLRKEINEFKEKNHKLQSVFNGLCKSLSNKQFDERISTVKKENQNYSERLQELQSGIAQISEEEKKKIEDEYEKNLKFWRQRKRMEELDIEIDLIGEDSLKAL
nr:3139_t:CDS:2 [Entrophospora candida]